MLTLSRGYGIVEDEIERRIFVALYPNIDMASEGSAGPYEGLPQLLELWKNFNPVDLAPLGMAATSMMSKGAVPKPTVTNPNYESSQDIVGDYQKRLLRLVRQAQPKMKWGEGKPGTLHEMQNVGRTRENMEGHFPDPVDFISKVNNMWLPVQMGDPKNPNVAINRAIMQGLNNYYSVARPSNASFEDYGGILGPPRTMTEAMMPTYRERDALTWQALTRNRPQMERYWSKPVFDELMESLSARFDPQYGGK